MVNTVLKDLKHDKAKQLIDDIIIPCPTAVDGLIILQDALDRLRIHNLKLKLSKCAFSMNQVNYLVREISAEGVRPRNAKIEAVLRMKSPGNVKQIRQFVGLSRFFRKLVKDYACVMDLLTTLTKK